MKKADEKNIIIISGDNNQINFGENKSHLFAIVIAAIIVVVALAVLTVSYCCPELLPKFVRWIISIAISS